MQTRNRRAVVASVTIAALLAVGGSAWWWTARDDAPAASSGSPAPTATHSPGDAPTTPAPGTATPSAPAVAEPAPPAPPAAGPALAGVEVVTTYAGWNDLSGTVEVGAYAAVVESGATCILTLRQGAGTVSVEGAATPDVSTTACGDLVVGRDRLGPGPWDAVVTYTSPTSTGATAPLTVEVP